jgi:hypothetical protein
MFVMPIKLSQLPDINQLLTVCQRLLPAARRLRLILPDQLPNHHKPPMPSMRRCVLNLLNLKIKLHIMQDKLVQTLVHMCRLMSHWLLLECDDLRMLRWTQHKNCLFPNFNSEHNCVCLCLCGQVYSARYFLANFAGVDIVAGVNGHLDFYDCRAY